MDTGHTRSGLRVATARRIRSAIHQFELKRRGLDTCWALAGCRRERPLSWGQPGDGMAARRFSRTDGKEWARRRLGTRAINGRPCAGDVRGDPSVLAAGRRCGMAASDPNRRQPLGNRVRLLPVCQPAPSAGACTDTPNATGAMVVWRGDRAWRRVDAGTDLFGSLPRRRSEQGPRSGRRSYPRQSRHGSPGLHRACVRDVCSWRLLGMAGLSLFGSQVPVAELVRSGYDLGYEPLIRGRFLAYHLSGEPGLSASPNFPASRPTNPNLVAVMEGRPGRELAGCLRRPENDSYRRLSPVAVHPGEGPVTEPTAATQPWRRPPLFMPYNRRSQ